MPIFYVTEMAYGCAVPLQVIGVENIASRDLNLGLQPIGSQYSAPTSPILRYGLSVSVWLAVGLLQVMANLCSLFSSLMNHSGRNCYKQRDINSAFRLISVFVLRCVSRLCSLASGRPLLGFLRAARGGQVPSVRGPLLHE